MVTIRHQMPILNMYVSLYSEDVMSADELGRIGITTKGAVPQQPSVCLDPERVGRQTIEVI